MSDDESSGRAVPKRQLDKKEAVRHMIHGAVRLIVAEEDPFIIHMLVQSADKVLIDIANHDKKPLAFDWAEYIRPEKKKYFFNRFREMYNFFKHADKDVDTELPVHDIAGFNVITLFVAIQNYRGLFGEITSHMALHNMFVQAVMPGIFTSEMQPDKLAIFEAGLEGIKTMTPAEFFSLTTEFKRQFAPHFDQERASDTQDVVDFYCTSFAELRRKDAGE